MKKIIITLFLLLHLNACKQNSTTIIIGTVMEYTQNSVVLNGGKIFYFKKGDGAITNVLDLYVGCTLVERKESRFEYGSYLLYSLGTFGFLLLFPPIFLLFPPIFYITQYTYYCN